MEINWVISLSLEPSKTLLARPLTDKTCGEVDRGTFIIQLRMCSKPSTQQRERKADPYIYIFFKSLTIIKPDSESKNDN